MQKIKEIIKDREIIKVNKKELIDKSLEFITRWYTSGTKEFNNLSNLEKKVLKSEVGGFNESEVAEFSASSMIEKHHNTNLIGANVRLSGNKKMNAHGVDLIHEKNNKIIFIEVKGAKDNAKQTQATLISNFKNAQKQLILIENPSEISRFAKVLNAAINIKGSELSEKVLENLLDFESRKDDILEKTNIELLATVVYPTNNFYKKFNNNFETKQFLIEVENRGGVLGEEILSHIDNKISESLEKNEKN